MRYCLQTLFLSMLSTSIFSQTGSDKSYYLKSPIVATPVDITKIYAKEGLVLGNRETLDTVKTTKEIKIQEVGAEPGVKTIIAVDTVFKFSITIEKEYAYTIIRQIGSFTIIKFWKLKDAEGSGLFQYIKKGAQNDGDALANTFDTLKSLKIIGLTAVRNTSDVVFDLSKSFFIVKTADLQTNSVEFESKKGLWSIGLLVLPIKIRPFATEKGQFDFADGFSVGTTFAWTLHHNWKTNFSHNALLYVGIGSYTADSLKIKEKRNDYKIATFSPALGWMVEKNNIQLSILAGIDFPSGNLQQKWVYRNKPWIGVGIGIGLFKIGNDTNAAKRSQANE